MKFRVRVVLILDNAVEARDIMEARHLAKIDIAQDFGHNVHDDMVFVEQLPANAGKED